MTVTTRHTLHGLDLELATRRTRGPLVEGRSPSRWMRGLSWLVLCLPAGALLAVLLVPAVRTMGLAISARPRTVGWCVAGVAAVVVMTVLVRHPPGREWKPARRPAGMTRSLLATTASSVLEFLIFTVGVPPRRMVPVMRRYLRALRWLRVRSVKRPWRPWERWMVWLLTAVMVAAVGVRFIFAVTAPTAPLARDDVAFGWDGTWSYVRSALWIAVALVMLVVAMLVAWWSRVVNWVWEIAVAPFAVAALVSAVAFRMIFQRVGQVWDVTSLRGWVLVFALMLVVAFFWTWMGVLIGLFRAGIDRVLDDPGLFHFVVNGRWWTMPLRLFEVLRPIALVTGLVVSVAAAEIFDAILIGVPGSLQYQLDTATGYWWRLASDHALPEGYAAVYGVPLAMGVGVLAWILQSGIRRNPHRARHIGHAVRTHNRPGKALWYLVIAFSWLWTAVPLLVLAVVAFRSKAVWAPGMMVVLGDLGLWQAMGKTALSAAVVSLVVITAATPLAFRLALSRSRPVFVQIVVTVLVVLAVLPAQSYLGPLDTYVDELSLSGVSLPLVLVHAASGFPLALLILRGVLRFPPQSPEFDALRGLAVPGKNLRRAFSAAWPSLGAVAVLKFLDVWNDFFVGLLVSGPGSSPWPLLLWGTARQFTENEAHLAAGALVAALPPILLLMATWRVCLRPGLTGGGVFR